MHNLVLDLALATVSARSSMAPESPPRPPSRSPRMTSARILAGPSQVGDGAIVERLARMRAACQALALELAGARRELKAAKSELRRLKQHHGEI